MFIALKATCPCFRVRKQEGSIYSHITDFILCREISLLKKKSHKLKISLNQEMS